MKITNSFFNNCYLRLCNLRLNTYDDIDQEYQGPCPGRRYSEGQGLWKGYVCFEFNNRCIPVDRFWVYKGFRGNEGSAIEDGTYIRKGDQGN